jgi:4-carboxymuconolactone decarboxylase
VCTELFTTRRPLNESSAEATEILGEQGLVEVIAIVGYYTLIGNILNVFEVAVPRGRRRPSHNS